MVWVVGEWTLQRARKCHLDLPFKAEECEKSLFFEAVSDAAIGIGIGIAVGIGNGMQKRAREKLSLVRKQSGPENILWRWWV